MNLFHRAHHAIFDPLPTEGNIVRLMERGRPFQLPASLKDETDYSDIGSTIAKAVKENIIMTAPEIAVAEQLRQQLETLRETITAGRDTLVNEQAEADKEHTAQIARLNDEIKSRNEAHDEATADYTARIADTERALHAVNASISDLDGAAAPALAPPVGVAFEEAKKPAAKTGNGDVTITT